MCLIVNKSHAGFSTEETYDISQAEAVKRQQREQNNTKIPFMYSYSAAGNMCTVRKFETKISRKGIAGPESQFPHSCVCEH
jgi:hypothetical protein